MQGSEASATPASNDNTIPSTCFASLEDFWPSSQRKSGSFMPSCWQEVQYTQCLNIFSANTFECLSGTEPLQRVGQWDFDRYSWIRTRHALLPEADSPGDNIMQHGDRFDTDSSTASLVTESTDDPRMPPIQVFDIVLDYFFLQFGSAHSYVHPATFSAARCPGEMLLAMSALVFCWLNSKGARAFVARAYKVSGEHSLSNANCCDTTALTFRNRDCLVSCQRS